MTDAAGSAPLAHEKQPKGLYLLFSVEMWERFSYYGMRALLVLFLVDEVSGWGWSKADASRLYGLYTGFVYFTPLLGGYLADRWLGTHRAMVIGGIVIAAGHFCLALSTQWTFFLGLLLIIIGTGFFKSNVSTMVGQLYREGDRRRDAGFTIFYMGINLGAFIGQIVCGYFAKTPRFGWHWGFGAAGVGMLIAVIMYMTLKRRFLGDIGDRPNSAASSKTGESVPAAPLTREERHRLMAILIFCFFNIFFWLAFEQAGSSMNFFAEERTDRVIGGYTVPSPWFQSVNPLIIILFAPAFASMWTWLGRRRLEPSIPVKFAMALFLVGAGFVVLVFGARASEGGVRVSPWWLTGAYVLHTWGELCLSPVGLSMITKLAPAKFASLLMGCWFLSSFFAHLAGGFIAATIERIERGELFTLLGGQADFFLIFVVSSWVAGIAILLLARAISRLMHGRG